MLPQLAHLNYRAKLHLQIEPKPFKTSQNNVNQAQEL
jgi:hypothetical protein